MQNEGPYLVSRLILDEVQESDYGQYSFTAKNVLGTDSVKDMHFTEGM